MNQTAGFDEAFSRSNILYVQLRQKQDINVCGGLRGKVKSAHQQISIPASFPQLFNLPHIGQCIRSSGLVNDLVVMFLNIEEG